MGTFVKKIQGMDQVAQKWGAQAPLATVKGLHSGASTHFLNATQNNWNKLQAKGTYYMKRSGHLEEIAVYLIGYKKKSTIEKF